MFYSSNVGIDLFKFNGRITIYTSALAYAPYNLATVKFGVKARLVASRWRW